MPLLPGSSDEGSPPPPRQVFIAFIAVDYITSCRIALEILIEIHQSGSLPKQLFLRSRLRMAATPSQEDGAGIST